MARRLLIDGEVGLRSTFLAAYEHCRSDVAKICFSGSSVGSHFALIEEKLVAAMPRQEDQPVAKKQPEGAARHQCRQLLEVHRGRAPLRPARRTRMLQLPQQRRQRNMLLVLLMPQRTTRHNIWLQRRSGRKSGWQSGNVTRSWQKHRRCEMKPG